MNAKQFLQWGGAVLVLVAVLGFFGVIGPTADRSIFGPTWWFDNGENWAHLVIGVVGLIAAQSLQEAQQKTLVWILGAVGVLVALYGWFVGGSFLGANLENPADNLLHLAVGGWALWAARKS